VDADVVVIGSGATGSLVAAHVARAGRKVMLLEGGPRRELRELYSSTIWSRRLKGGPPTAADGRHPVAPAFEAGWGAGGTALHHYACWLRLHVEDFRLASLYGVGLDWPIEYEDLRPYYDSVQAEVGISGDARLEVWRPPGAPYPMPPLPVLQHGEVIARGFRAAGERVAPLPMAINSIPYRGRPPCIQDGWCDAGCPTGALANPLAVFGAELAARGVEQICDAQVSRLLTDGTGRRVSEVEYYDRQSMRRTARAPVVVLAAYTIQNVRILLNSASDRHPAGLGNSSQCLGRRFMSHGAVNLYGMFGQPTENHLGRSGGQLVSQERYAKDPRRGFIAGHTWRIGHALKFGDLGGIANARVDLFGPALTSFITRAATHLGTMYALTDNLPDDANRIVLDTARDRNGLPLARVTHTLGRDTLADLDEATTEGLRLLRAAGATEAWADAVRTEHLMGGTTMGADPRRSATDAFGRVHDVDNLFVSGPSLFASSGAVNPTFTAVALAARTAAYINREWAGLRAAGTG
jgi:choline dehydrogenase-like flavoprotein